MINIRQNYENYERVQKAFKEFVHALVWESMDIDAGVHEDEINEHIERYCRNNADQMIALTNDSVTKFIKSLYARYKVSCYECNGDGRISKVGETIKTDNMEVALRRASIFYRKAKKPYVEVFDMETLKYIAKWD